MCFKEYTFMFLIIVLGSFLLQGAGSIYLSHKKLCTSTEPHAFISQPSLSLQASAVPIASSFPPSLNHCPKAQSLKPFAIHIASSFPHLSIIAQKQWVSETFCYTYCLLLSQSLSHCPEHWICSFYYQTVMMPSDRFLPLETLCYWHLIANESPLIGDRQDSSWPGHWNNPDITVTSLVYI